MQDQVSEVLLTVTDHSSNRRYPILKERLRGHLSWLAEQQGSKKQQGFEKELQRMIDLLCTHDDYEKELVPLLERTRNHNPTRKHTQISFGRVSGAVGRFFASPQSTSNHADRPELRYMNLKVPYIDDAEFLTELFLLPDEHPAYAQIVEEIIREATESLGAKLNRVSKDIAYHAEREIGRLLQEVSSSFAEQRHHAEKMAYVELMDLIRRDLDEEPRHPTNPYVL